MMMTHYSSEYVKDRMAGYRLEGLMEVQWHPKSKKYFSGS